MTPEILNIFSSETLLAYFEATTAPIIAPIEAIITLVSGKERFMKCPIPPESAMNAMINTEVPIAFLMGYPSMKTNATRIVTPPPTPKIPQIRPTNIPIKTDATIFLSLKKFSNQVSFLFNGFLKKAIPVINTTIPSPSPNAKSGINLAIILPIKAKIVANIPMRIAPFTLMFEDFL